MPDDGILRMAMRPDGSALVWLRKPHTCPRCHRLTFFGEVRRTRTLSYEFACCNLPGGTQSARDGSSPASAGDALTDPPGSHP